MKEEPHVEKQAKHDEAETLVFAGSASRDLTVRICKHLGIEVSPGTVITFSEGSTFVRAGRNVRGRDVYLVQGTAFPVNDNFMELLFWIDAFKRASAATVTVVIPYFNYAKGDKKDEPRVSIRARVCAEAIEAAGANRVVTMDLHAPQIQGFFKVPLDDLTPIKHLCDAVRARVEHLTPENFVVVSPDTGFAKKARKYAAYLGVPLAIADKDRSDHTENAQVLEIIGEVENRTALLVDDFTISAGTLISAAEELLARGATKVMAAVTHGVFSEGATKKIDDSRLTRLFITDSIETQPEPLSDKVEVVSVAPLFAEAIRRIHDRESISVLFQEAEGKKDG